MTPRLRNDLVATTRDEQGVACVEVVDPVGGTSFRFYDFEFALAQQLTGQPLAGVIAWARTTYGIELPTEALDQLLEKLAGLGFLDVDRSQAGPESPAPTAPPSEPTRFAETVPATIPLGPAVPLSRTEGAGTPPSQEGTTEAEARPASDDRPNHLVQLVGRAPTPSSPTNPFALLPQLQVLAGPLPPPVSVPDPGPAIAPAPWPVATDHVISTAGSARAQTRGIARAPALVPAPAGGLSTGARTSFFAGAIPDTESRVPSQRGNLATGAPAAKENPEGPGVETPLASIAHAIAESHAPPPVGALDIGLGGGGAGRAAEVRSNVPLSLDAGAVGAVPTIRAASPPSDLSAKTSSVPSFSLSSGPSSSPKSTPSEPVPSMPAAATKETDLPREDRRLPPRPEVVVMPPMIEPSTAGPPPTRRGIAFLVLLLLGIGLASGVWLLRPIEGPPAPASSTLTVPRVHVVSPQPTTFYGWFDAVGVVVPGQDDTLAFRVGGRVLDAMPPGTTFSAGETIARLQGAVDRELNVNRLRSRVAYYEQLRDSSRADGSEAAVRQAEAKLDQRRQELANAQAALAELEIRPKFPGVIAELLLPKGVVAKPGAAVFRVRGTGTRVTLAVSAQDAARARALAFCRVETIPGTGGGGGAQSGGVETKARAVDCALPAATAGAEGDSRVVVDLIGPVAVAPGTQVRLANARYDAVFPIPRAAVVREGDVDHVWIVSGGGRFAERRTVEITATIDALALIAHGISVGDAVVLDPPPTLKAGAEIDVVR